MANRPIEINEYNIFPFEKFKQKSIYFKTLVIYAICFK